jgi:chromosome segregation ATPase
MKYPDGNSDSAIIEEIEGEESCTTDPDGQKVVKEELPEDVMVGDYSIKIKIPEQDGLVFSESSANFKVVADKEEAEKEADDEEDQKEEGEEIKEEESSTNQRAQVEETEEQGQTQQETPEKIAQAVQEHIQEANQALDQALDKIGEIKIEQGQTVEHVDKQLQAIEEGELKQAKEARAELEEKEIDGRKLKNIPNFQGQNFKEQYQDLDSKIRKVQKAIRDKRRELEAQRTRLSVIKATTAERAQKGAIKAEALGMSRGQIV